MEDKRLSRHLDKDFLHVNKFQEGVWIKTDYDLKGRYKKLSKIVAWTSF